MDNGLHILSSNKMQLLGVKRDTQKATKLLYGVVLHVIEVLPIL